MGTSLKVQWLRLNTSTARGIGSIPGQKAKITHATWCGQKKNKKKNQAYLPQGPGNQLSET